MLLRIIALGLALTALMTLLTNPPPSRPALVGAVAPLALPTVPGLPPPPEPTNPPPGITGAAPVGGQAELWPGASICAGYHAGAMDWCAPLGTEVFSPATCTMLMQGEYYDDPRFGAYVMCNTDGGLELYVGHLDMATVNPLGFRPGDRIAAGQTIGYIGPHFITTHVHTQIRRGGQLVGPDQWWAEWEGR